MKETLEKIIKNTGISIGRAVATVALVVMPYLTGCEDDTTDSAPLPTNNVSTATGDYDNGSDDSGYTPVTPANPSVPNSGTGSSGSNSDNGSNNNGGLENFCVTSIGSGQQVSGDIITLYGGGAYDVADIDVKVYTNDWYPQSATPEINSDGSWSIYPIYLRGQGVYNNHTIEVDLTHKDGSVNSITIENIVRQ